MIILVCGGRDYDDYERVCEVLDEVACWSSNGVVKIVNGGCRTGADPLSSKWARERGYGEHLIEVPVADTPEERVRIGAKFDWITDGKAAGPLRNLYMIETYNPDQGVAFPGDRGTLNAITRLFYAGVNTWIVGK